MSSTDSGDGDGTASSQNPVVSMPLTVVGVLDAATNNYDAFSSGVVMSLEDMDTLQAKIDGKTNTTSRTKTNYDQVVVHAQNIKDVPGIEAQIKMSGYQTTSFEQTRKEIEKQSRGIQLALGGIGAVSFPGGGHRHRQHHDYVRVGTHSGNRHYEGARLLCEGYSHDVPM